MASLSGIYFIASAPVLEETPQFIYQLEYLDEELNVIASGFSSIKGLWPHHASGKFYFNDFRVLQRCDFDGSNVESLVSPGDLPFVDEFMNLRGPTVDQVNDKVWFADTYYDRVMKCDLDGSNVEVMFSGGHDNGFANMYDMTIDPDNEHVYWSTRIFAGHPGPADYGIHRINYDGTGHTIVASHPTWRFAGLYLDVSGQVMYWCDLLGNEIGSSGLDSGTTEVVMSGLASPYYMSLDLANSKVYWSSSTEGLVSIDDIGGGNNEVLASGLTTVHNIWFSSAMSSGTPSPETPSSYGTQLKIIHNFTRAGMHNPQLIGEFSISTVSVNMELWDITDGQNTVVPIINSGCYAIGNTGRFGWSTEHIPFTGEHVRYQYFYRMTSNEDESVYGEFFITVPRRR